MKRVLTIIGGVCVFGAFCATFAPSATASDAAAFEAVAMTTTSATTTVSVEQQKLDFTTVEISACEIIREEPGKQGHWEPVQESATIRVEKRFDMGKDTYHTELVDSWDIAESNPHTVTIPGDPNTDGFILYAVMEAPPHGYSVNSGGKPSLAASAEIGWQASSQSYSPLTFRLNKETYMEADFPIEGKFDANVRLYFWENDPRERDYDKLFPELNVSLINLDTDEEIATWNTTEHPEMTISDLDYRFEDWQMKSSIRYGIKISNLPQGCRIVGGDPYEIAYKEINLDNADTEITEYIGIETPESIKRMYETLVTTTTTTTAETTKDTTTTVSEYTTTATTTATETTVTTESTTTTTTTTTTKQPLSDKTLCEWAAKDYSDKNQTSVSAEISGREDGKVSITLKDETGKTVDTYVIDETSGIGENAAGEAVNLPQTGNNAPADYLIAVGALLLTIAGAWALYTANKRSLTNK